jgi:hypothetical protein
MPTTEGRGAPGTAGESRKRRRSSSQKSLSADGTKSCRVASESGASMRRYGLATLGVVWSIELGGTCGFGNSGNNA